MSEPTDVRYDFETHIAAALVRAINNAGGKPYMAVVTANLQGPIPKSDRDRGQIILNVSDRSVSNLSIHDGMVNMSARFKGQPAQLTFPSEDIIAVFDHQTGEGRAVGDYVRLQQMMQRTQADPSILGEVSLHPTPRENPLLIIAAEREAAAAAAEPIHITTDGNNVVSVDFIQRKKIKD